MARRPPPRSPHDPLRRPLTKRQPPSPRLQTTVGVITTTLLTVLAASALLAATPPLVKGEEAVEGAVFTEILYNPAGIDNKKEFIELVGAPNLSGWVISDAASNDTLRPRRQNSSSSVSLIVEEGFSVENLSCSVYIAGATIGNGLNNGGDELSLFDPAGRLAARTSYDGRAAREGYAIEWRNDSWREGRSPGGTPCVAGGEREEEGGGATGGGGGEGDSEVSPGDGGGEGGGGGREGVVPENGRGGSGEDGRGNETLEQLPGPASGEPPFSLALTLPARLFTNRDYDSFLVARRGEGGGEELVNVTIAYNLSRNGTLLLASSFSAALATNGTARGGSGLSFSEAGAYQLCARIVAAKDGVNGSAGASAAACRPLNVEEDLPPCNASLRLELLGGRRLYRSGETIRFRNRLATNLSPTPPFTIKYWVEDAWGRVVRERRTGNEGEKQFTPRLGSERLNAYFLKNEVENLSCKLVGSAKGGEELVVVLGENSSESVGSGGEEGPPSLEILSLEGTSKGFSFGDAFKARIRARRGDARKYAVRLWVEDERGRRVSEVTSLSLFTRSAVEASLPVLLHEEGASGEYRLVVEGLGVRRSRHLRVGASGEEELVGGGGRGGGAGVEIASLFTRAQRGGEAIFRARILGEGTFIVELVSEGSFLRQPVNLSGAYAFTGNATLAEGPNIIVLRLLTGGTGGERLVAEKSLFVEVVGGAARVARGSWSEEALRRASRDPVGIGESSGGAASGGGDVATTGGREGRGGGGDGSGAALLVGSGGPGSSGSSLAGRVVTAGRGLGTSPLALLLGVAGALGLGVILQHRS